MSTAPQVHAPSEEAAPSDGAASALPAPIPPPKHALAALLSPRVGFGLVLALYLLAFPYHPHLRSPNELCRLWQTRALVEHGTLDINRALQEYGRVGDLSVKEGRFYPSKAPLISFAAVPIYTALRAVKGSPQAVTELELVFWSRLLLTVLPTLLMLALVRRFLRAHVREAFADALTVAYALGTLAFSYSLLFMSHQATAVLLFTSFYALWRCARGEWRARGYLVAGAAAGASVVAEYTSGLGVVCLLVYGVLSLWFQDGTRRERLGRIATNAGLTMLGALPFVLALMAYHQAAFGHPLESGYKYLADAGYQPWHLGGFLGIRTPDPRAFALSFFSPLRGLFALSPLLLLGIFGLVLLVRRALRDRSFAAIAGFSVLLVLAYTYFTSSFSYESWGWTTGPRHLTGLVPFLLLPVALTLERIRASGRSEWLGLGAGLAAGAVLVTGLLSLLNYIPDDVSSPLFALSLPLFLEGYLPPTLLTALTESGSGVGGMLLLGCVAAAAVWVAARLLAGSHGRWQAGLAIALCTLGLHLGALRLATEFHPGDRGALNFLKQTWLASPEGDLRLWPPRR